MGIQGKVNESLSKTFAYKGEDGLSDAERRAYEECRKLSCLHEACYRRYLYSSPARQEEKCSSLMDNWRQCFEEKRALYTAPEGRSS
jgi:transposase-like protein